jgi:hypothetical protein
MRHLTDSGGWRMVGLSQREHDAEMWYSIQD